MKNEIVGKIAVACFAGACIGTMLARSLGYFWWVGVLIGGACGYLLFSFSSTLSAFRNVVRNTALLPRSIWQWWRRERGDVIRLLRSLTIFAVVGVVSVAMIVFTVCIMAYDLFSYRDFFAGSNIIRASLITDWIDIGCWIGMHVTLICLAWIIADCGHERTGLAVAILFMPSLQPAIIPTLFVTGCIAIVISVLFVAFILISWVWLVALRTVRMIHSDIRLLCLTDAMLGATAGYFWPAGTPYAVLVGGAVGAILGILNYQLISVRIYKFARSRP